MGCGFVYYYGTPVDAKLRQAWEKYYENLSWMRKMKKVNERVRKGKMPTSLILK